MNCLPAEIAVLGIDLWKTTCSVAGLDGGGEVVLRKRVQRHRLLAFLSGLSPCIVAMEAAAPGAASLRSSPTAKINGVEPFVYLKATLKAIAAGRPASRLDELFPWNFQPSS